MDPSALLGTMPGITPPTPPDSGSNISSPRTGSVQHESPVKRTASLSQVKTRPLVHAQDVAAHFNAAALKDLSSVTVEIAGLPKNVTTREIYNSLAKLHLCIARIDILENKSRERNGRARVIIEPVPKDWPPWGRSSGFLTLTRTKGRQPVRVRVCESSTRGFHDTVKTPLDIAAPREQAFRPRGLLFGMMADKDTMYEMPQYNYQGVGLSVHFSKRFIEITFNIQLRRTGVKFFKIPIRFTHIKKLIRINHKDGTWALAVCLPSPPEFFMKATGAGEIQQTHDDELSFWQERDLWLRQTQISHEPHLAKNQPAKLENRPENLNIGRWTTYYFLMSHDSLRSWETIEPRLRDYNIKVEHSLSFRFAKPSQMTAWTLLAANDIISSGSTSNADLLGSTQNIILPFEVRYQLEACISQGLLGEYSIDTCFLEKLASFDTDRARMMLEGVADGNIPYYQPMTIFDEPRIVNYWPSAKIPPHAAMIRKVVVTPTTMYVKTPTVEVTNRVLRHYSDLKDRFLRVQFTDEITFGRIWSDQISKKSDELYVHVHRILRNGIVVGGRHFHLLAWSNSQFREHGAFFFSPSPHITCDDIRDAMGDLKHIRSVGKFAARMGQCFTTTRQVSGVSIPKIKLISDIKIQKNDKIWTFTDGAGKVSPFYAQMIAHDHNLIDTPSCLQVRIAGVKGILVVWLDVPPSEVHIRPSQEKFKGPYNGIEVIKVSRYSHATLNRQIIPILNCLGVEDDIFIDLLEEELKEYDEAMCSSTKAAELLRHRVDENQITLVMAEMVEAFMDTKEPFLDTLLRLWRCWALQRLKQKAAISVKKSAFLYGCVDETGVLRGYSENKNTGAEKNIDSLPQIFLQVPMDGSEAPNSTNYRVVTGVCVVGRNPSLHPGDVRVVEAVDRPELRHLRDVVVFPQKGDRDIPSMCSGGDLDGDDFFIIWDRRLIPTEWNFKPMDHDAEDSKPSKDTAVTMEHACSFFAQYMKNDSLGLIATAHLAWADKVGPKHPNCIEIAQLHSKAVDYVKSGSPAVMHKRLNAPNFPHFMERNSKTYKSEKPLGRIYDLVKTVSFDPIYDMAFDGRILSRFQLSADELTKAQEIKGKYDVAMRRLMGRHENPVTEFEIWSTFILSKPRVGTDYKLREEVGREAATLKDRFRSICAEAVMGIKRKDLVFSYSMIDLEKLDRFVAAMYSVTHDEVQGALRARAMPLIDDDGNKIADDQGPDFPMPLVSFPWLFHRELSRISTGGRPPMRQWKPACDGSQNVATVATEPETEPKSEASSQPPAYVASSDITKEGNIASKKEGGVEKEEEDYVRTSSGQVVHRGETLDLFHTQTPSSPRSGKDEGDEDEGSLDETEFEEVEISNEEDMEEDALDMLTRKIGGI